VLKSANRGEVGGSQYKLPSSVSPEGGPAPKHVEYVCVFLGSVIICQLYKLALSDQAEVTLQLKVNLSDLV
jgi:hypothetical protein